MGGYLPSTGAQQARMLEYLGLSSPEELFAAVPREVLLGSPPDLPHGLSELEARRVLEAMAGRNRVFSTILRGAGAYDHYIPAAVGRIASKESFVTAYTPYQAELSQGILQAIFEYQTMICSLTGMDASNASVYDGATAAAEAVAMTRERGRTVAVVSETVNPEVLATIRTYCFGADAELVIAPEKGGVTDLEGLKPLLDGRTACLYLQQPNFFGLLEPCGELIEAAHATGAKVILGVDPASLGVLKAPGEWGADIAVGEGQPLGLPLSWGGPYLGFMACTAPLLRRLPGRIVGETTDRNGERAYVLTLQAREQHIRREKAGSNICSNQAHCALTASVYLSVMGPEGLRQVGRACHAKAVWFAGRLEELGFVRRYPGEIFCEFLTESPAEPERVLAALEERGILGGLPVAGGLLWCVTETVSRAQLEEALAVLKEVCKA